MNVKRFTARTSREALALVKQAFGEDAVVMSTKPCAEGVEVVAMAPESVQQLERVGAAADAVPAALRGALRDRAQAALPAPQRPPLPSGTRHEPRSEMRQEPRQEPRHDPRHDPRLEPRHDPRLEQRQEPRQEPRHDPLPEPRQPARPDPRLQGRREPRMDPEVERDVEQLQMSTLSFQDYVRERMLKRRDAERAAEQSASAEPPPPAPLPPSVAPIEAARARHAARREVPTLRDEVQLPAAAPTLAEPHPAAALSALRGAAAPGLPGRSVEGPIYGARRNDTADGAEMMTELRSMRGLIEQRFGALAFMEKLQRQPRQAHLAQRLLDAGFSPALIRKLVTGLPPEGDETAWAASVLERNLPTAEREPALEEAGGIYALIGATGVGKTTSTAKLAAAFATRHGAANLGLITLDAYRVGAHEQLRTYGRILGVPVHTAHDRASLEDLLELLAAKRMVLIDTAGMAQRDSRTRELLDMLSHSAINRLLVVNASAQGETIEDQLAAYAAPSCRGVVLSKMDEAVKLGPALDSMIRHRLKVLAVANGQRVPEDWHRLSANALVQRALKGGGGPAWKLDENDVNLIFAGLPAAAMAGATAALGA